MIKTVFQVGRFFGIQREKEDLINEDVNCSEVFSSLKCGKHLWYAESEKAIPGFAICPGVGFSIDEHVIDQGSWLEGFWVWLEEAASDNCPSEVLIDQLRVRDANMIYLLFLNTEINDYVIQVFMKVFRASLPNKMVFD